MEETSKILFPCASRLVFFQRGISLRNQLFVVLTRSKAWVSFNGVDEYPMCEEMRQVIKNGNTFTFNYKKPFGRVIGEEILT